MPTFIQNIYATLRYSFCPSHQCLKRLSRRSKEPRASLLPGAARAEPQARAPPPLPPKLGHPVSPPLKQPPEVRSAARKAVAGLHLPLFSLLPPLALSQWLPVRGGTGLLLAARGRIRAPRSPDLPAAASLAAWRLTRHGVGRVKKDCTL